MTARILRPPPRFVKACGNAAEFGAGGKFLWNFSALYATIFPVNFKMTPREDRMNDIILVKLGEIILKGLNRRYFEQKLMANMRRRLSHIGKFRVYCIQSTVYVEAQEDNADIDAAFEALQNVFGIVALVRAAACEKDKDAIAALA